VSSLNAEVSSLKTEVSSLKNEVVSLKTELSECTAYSRKRKPCQRDITQLKNEYENLKRKLCLQNREKYTAPSAPPPVFELEITDGTDGKRVISKAEQKMSFHRKEQNYYLNEMERLKVMCDF
jgi:septal ring factor EnvC (AmiA/AmiB activator)